MLDLQTIVVDDLVVWASVSQSVSLSRGRMFLLIRQVASLRCGHYFRLPYFEVLSTFVFENVHLMCSEINGLLLMQSR